MKCSNVRYRSVQIHLALSFPGEGAVPLEATIKNRLSCGEGPTVQAVLARLYQIPAKADVALTVLKAAFELMKGGVQVLGLMAAKSPVLCQHPAPYLHVFQKGKHQFIQLFLFSLG